MLLYLDVCCFNRPWDDQSQDRIRLETEAKLMLQERVRAGVARLAWSYALDHECSLNPFGDRLEAILRWRGLASINVGSSEAVLTLAADFMRGGLMVFDALHVACAVAAGADVFVTTDDRLLRKLKQVQSLPALLPGGAIARLEGWYEN